MPEKTYGIVVFGATGFTGRLVAEYLHSTYGIGSEANAGVRWAMAGRSLDKLKQVRNELGIGDELPLLVADASDAASLKALVAQTQVVITTVGPYQLYGNELVAACAEAGTDYVDLCGEPGWMAAKIPQLQPVAEASGARIVFSCGFDSIPFDLGVVYLQSEAMLRLGEPLARVHGRVKTMKGTMSGGTFASGKATMAAAAKDPSILKLMVDPFALAPGFDGPAQPGGMVPHHDDAVEAWVAPFMMAVINTKNVHRTNFLAGFPYGRDFRYDEMMIVPGLGEIGKAAAEALAKLNPMAADNGPAPGEGPSKEERESGHYDILFIAEADDGRSARLSVKGDRDPGYGSTSKMIAESALCLVRDVAGDGGIWTAGALMPDALQTRLAAHAGLRFTVE